MLLRCLCQEDLVVGHRYEDSGRFVFVVCRKGFEDVLGQNLDTGEEVVVDVIMTRIEDDS